MDWDKIFSAVLPGVAEGVLKTGAGIFGAKQAAKASKKGKESELNQAIALKNLDFEQQKELLALKASLAGGGGGGGSGVFTGFTDPQRVSAMQEQDALRLAALRQLLEGYQAPLLAQYRR